MQGMELALRTPLTDAVRNALVSSWRRLSLHVQTLRLAAMGLTDTVRRQDQVLIVDEGGSEVVKRGNRITQSTIHTGRSAYRSFPLMSHGKTS
jgi:hypothetical protein